MALYDQFNASQANNGVGPPNPQVTSGAPGYPMGSWGNQPGGLAGGMQQFMAARGMLSGAIPGQLGGGMPPAGGAGGVMHPPGTVAQPPAGIGSPFMPPGGAGGVMGPGAMLPPGAVSPFMAPVQRGVGTVGMPSPPASVPPIGSVSTGIGTGFPGTPDAAGNTGMPGGPVAGPGGQTNLAGGMRPYLGA